MCCKQDVLHDVLSLEKVNHWHVMKVFAGS